MAMKTKGLIKKSTDTTQKTSVGNTYDAAKKATLVLNMPSGFPLNFHLSAVYVQMSSLNSNPTKLSVKISTDSGGDESIMTGTESTIEAGVTTATDGSAIYKLDVDYVFDSPTIYAFFKADTGTVSIDKIELTYHE